LQLDDAASFSVASIRFHFYRFSLRCNLHTLSARYAEGAGAMSDFYRADVIGSMLRPSYLKVAQQSYKAGRITAAEFKRIEDRAVDAAIATQEGAGVDVVTDGEMRRGHFVSPLTDVIEGAHRVEAKTRWRRAEGDKEKEDDIPIIRYALQGRIRRVRSLAGEEFAYARSRARRPLKVTLPSPLLMVISWSPSLKEYPDPYKLVADAADLIRDEVRELAGMGCQYIQIDAPELTMMMSGGTAGKEIVPQGGGPERMLTEGVDVIDSLADVPGVTFGLHICRGNNQGYYMTSGGYESLSEQVFKRAKRFHTFLLEYDDYRSGSFEPLKDLPSDKRVVLGLVSTKSPQLEPSDVLVRRVEEASRYFPREQMALSTQCGFASTSEGNPLSDQAQADKLKLVADVAHRLWH
jgi:5-methyltetrahydropteroyltriglutamate--homocysteine methyltransferase